MNMQMNFSHGLIMLVFWSILIYLVLSLIPNNSKNDISSLDILKKRLANGEITKEQYADLKKTIIE
jgi:uncharacterized membrane protein